MDRLELRRITLFPGVDDDDVTDIVILVGNFSVPTGLRVAESALSNQQVCSFFSKMLILATEVAMNVTFVALFVFSFHFWSFAFAICGVNWLGY